MRQKSPPRAKSPLIDFTYTLFKYGADLRFAPRVIWYYFKFTILEPFRLIDRGLMKWLYADARIAEDPVFVLGYYRSGTTHLQEILLRDGQFGYLNFHQCFAQNGFLSNGRPIKWAIDRTLKLVGFRHPAHNIPLDLDMPGEEDVSMVSSGFRLASCFGQIYPRAFKEFFEKTAFFETCTEGERELFEAEMQDFILRLSIANGGKRLLLKSPPQTARVEMLSRLYPNAKFIFIHRNPHHVFRSNLKLWETFRGQCLQDFDASHARECILWSFDKTIERYERDKKLLRPDQLAEVRFDDLQARPLEVMEGVYRQLGLPGFELARPAFQKYLAEKHGSNIDRYAFQEEDFRDVESHLRRWLDLWGYSRPGSSAARRETAQSG